MQGNCEPYWTTQIVSITTAIQLTPRSRLMKRSLATLFAERSHSSVVEPDRVHIEGSLNDHPRPSARRLFVVHIFWTRGDIRPSGSLGMGAAFYSQTRSDAVL